MKKLLCKIFGHSMVFDSCNVAGPSTCKWCGYKKPGIVWPCPPKIKMIKENSNETRTN